MDPYRVLDLKALKCFMAVARTGSLTRAGIELGISEPAVSQRVKALESYLGTKLYEAGGGRVHLTTAGEQLAGKGIRLFEQLEEMESDVGVGETGGTITVASEDVVQLNLLPSVVQRLIRDYPRIQLRLISRTPLQTVDAVRNNQADVGIIAQRPLPPGITFHPWQSCDGYVVIPVGHPLVRRGLPKFRDLLDEGIVARYPLVIAESQEDRLRMEQALRSRGLPLNVAFEVGTLETVKRYVAMGLGIGVVSGICLTEEDATRLVAIQIPTEFGGSTTYGVVMREDKYISRPLAALLPLLGVAAPGARTT